ncbi:hypothetical protein LINPERHAP2_LOCUS15812, partial [Linum perenne]
CSHAIACIQYNRERPESYVDSSLKVEAGLRSYAYAIHPLNDSSQWIRGEGPRIRPPTLPHSTSGPKQKKRRKEAGEMVQQKKNKRGQDIRTMTRTGMVMHCSLCKGEGHNKRKCNVSNEIYMFHVCLIQVVCCGVNDCLWSCCT